MPFSNDELQERVDQLDAIMSKIEGGHGLRDAENCLVLARALLSNLEDYATLVPHGGQELLLFQEVTVSFDRLYRAIKENVSRSGKTRVVFYEEAAANHLDC